MIEQITIRNFKSIGDVTIDLSPLTVFIGRSGAGKSSILRALRFVRNYLLVGDQASSFEGGWSRICPCGLPAKLEIEARFRLPGYTQLFGYQIAWDASPQGSPLTSESLTYGNNDIFRWQGRDWVTWPSVIPVVQDPNRKSWLGSFPTISEAVLAFAAWTNGVGWHDFPATVFSPTYRASDAAGESASSRGLSDGAGNYLSVVRDLTQDLRDHRSRRQILARLHSLNPTVRSIELDSLLSPSKVIVGHQQDATSFLLDLGQESDGFRRFYSYLLALYQTPPKLVLMFEEPENGLYPGALQDLAEEFSAAASESRSQVLLTTHSPNLLDGINVDCIRVVDLDLSTMKTRVGRLEESQAEAVRDSLLHPGELFTVDRARIEPSSPNETLTI